MKAASLKPEVLHDTLVETTQGSDQGVLFLDVVSRVSALPVHRVRDLFNILIYIFDLKTSVAGTGQWY